MWVGVPVCLVCGWCVGLWVYVCNLIVCVYCIIIYWGHAGNESD